MPATPSIASCHLNDTRSLWVEPAQAGRSDLCLIVLDGELYRDRVKAPKIVQHWQQEQHLPATTVYVSHKDSAARHADYICSEAYAHFVAHELLPWIAENVGLHERFFLVGLSLSGLAAIHTALRFPGVFSGVLAQSPSAWWNEEWLTGSLARTTTIPQRFWISVGTRETQTDIHHAPSGMHQKVSQLDSVRRLREALQNAGHEVLPAEFDGGHDPARWAEELSPALTWLVRDEAAEQIRVAESRSAELRSGAVEGVGVEDAVQRARELLTNLETK